jgi:perosamine synthetase
MHMAYGGGPFSAGNLGAMKPPRIPVAGPLISELEIAYTAQAAEHDWYGNAAQSVKRFESAFAARHGVKHAFAVPHCTAALHLALDALGIGPGDEVIVPETTWVATVAAVIYQRATPIFADVDPHTWCISAESVASLITPRTKAILTVDLYGGVPEMSALYAIAAAHGVAIVEDAAEAIGARWNGRPAGALGDVATFSFHGTKTLTTGGEGGMLVTDRDDIATRVAALRDHGRKPGDFALFVTDEIGFKYRMNSLSAAFGLAQLERLDELVDRKREIFSWYSEGLHDLEGVTLNVEPAGTFNTYWMSTIVVDRQLGLGTRTLMSAFDAEGIDTRPFFPPLSSLTALRGTPDAAAAALRSTVAYDLADRAINLPSAMILTRDQVATVCTVLTKIVHGARSES